jgi:type II secretory pathway pseudopilin PulG
MRACIDNHPNDRSRASQTRIDFKPIKIDMAHELLYNPRLRVDSIKQNRLSLKPMRIFRANHDARATSAFTLIEVAVAMAIAVLAMAGMFQGYALASRRAQFSDFQLAANAMAMQQMESIVAATWVISGTSVTNIFSPTLTNTQVAALGVPSSGTNLVYATNFATVQQISTNPPYVMVQVSCVWGFMGMGTFTNTVAVLRGPDL